MSVPIDKDILMADAAPQFGMARRGYETSQVDSYLRQLTGQVERAESMIAELSEQVEQQRGNAQPSSYAGLGGRIEQILLLAEEEASELRAAATTEADRTRSTCERLEVQVRADIEAYANEVRSDADAQAQRTIEEARRQADRIRDEADRDAAIRREEAEALYEGQRAKAANAAANFETTLADRRDRAEREFAERTAAAELQYTDVASRSEQLRLEAEKLRADAERRATRAIDEAHAQAEEILYEAKSRAEQVRAESERELAAATQRRDSINDQLVNVRRMLTTLGGAAFVAQVDDDVFAGDKPAEPAPAEVAPVAAATPDTDAAEDAQPGRENKPVLQKK